MPDYYVFFIDADLRLRVPTWCPFRLQVYGNGHSYRAWQLRKRGVEYRTLDNAWAGLPIADGHQSGRTTFRWRRHRANGTSLLTATAQ